MNTSTFQTGLTNEGWQRAVHFEDVWGTVVILEVRGETLPLDTENLIAQDSLLQALLAWVDSIDSMQYQLNSPRHVWR